MISCEVSGSRAAVNSSAKIRGGSFKMIFAKATRCASPPDSSSNIFFF